MKLTKKLEAEVLKVYKAYWDAYLNGDMKTFAAMLDDDITVFGTAVSEVFNNKKETLRFYKATADQLVGKAQFRNRKINVSEVDSNVLVNEQCDLYFLMDRKWTFYGHVRVSAILKHTKTGWKLVHQHGSFPDMRAEEGEPLAAEKIKAENIQLRDAVKRRTIELENKNRELEIEAAVERVRAKALAMHKSEEIIEVVKTLRNQLLGLNLDGVTAVSICLRQEDGRVRFWDITDLETTGRYSADITFNMAQADPRLYLQKIWSSKKKIIAIEQDANDLKITLKWLSQYDKRTADEIRKLIRINKIKHGWHRAVKLANGRLITDFINEPPVEIESILLKIGAAFDLAYKRFLDLKNAEAQAREARIEAALERVRARTMAMHKSSDLLDVVKVLGEQLELLHVKFDSVNFNTDYLEKDWNLWLYNSGVPMYPDKLHIPYLDHPCFNRPREAYKEGTDLLSFVFTKEEKDILFDHIYANSIARNAPEARKKYTYAAPGLVWSIAFTKHTSVTISNYYGEPFSEDENAILRRFANVFEQSYTRFLDLQKAEAQAKEAMIEAALERVRSRTMAMQKSEELKEVIRVVYDQFVHLNIHIEHTGFIMDYKARDDMHIWLADQHAVPFQVTIPYFDCAHWNSFNEAKEKGTDFFANHLGFEEKNKFYQDLFELIPGLPEEAKEYYFSCPGLAISTVLLENVGLYIENFSGIPYTDEENKTLMRFGKVFQQTFTRFLDLQKAEAQSREAQIELGLERVRARAMAMQNSDELKELIGTVFTELTKLDLVLTRCLIVIFDPKTNGSTWWMANSEAPSDPIGLYIKYHEHPAYLSYVKAWHERDLKWRYILEGKEKKEWDDFLFVETELSQLPDFVIAGMKAPDRVYLNASFNSFGNLTLASLEPLSDEHFDILLRFAKVFDLTYTRFNDLKQAEAQAREAKIEAALERVRSRTMAMHKSDELNETNTVIIQQIRSLEIRLYAFGIHICHADEPISEAWMGDPVGGYMPKVIYDHSQDPLSIRMYAGWKEGKTLAVEKLEGDALKEHFGYMITLVPDRSIFDNLVAPESLVFHFAYFTYGFLVFLTQEPCPEEHSIFKRLANVFEQTYTRFLDLQKAEAQSREAQIELGLERVRARAMAMRNSDELKELIGTVFTELTKLDLVLTRCLIVIFDPKTNGSTWWMANSEAPSDPIGLYIKYHEHPAYLSYVKAWHERDLKWRYILEGKDKKEWDDFLFVETELSHLPDFVIAGMKAPDRVYLNASFNSFGNLTLASLEPLSDEHFDILLRFAKVFDLTYTRFNDLKQAEAQAKEAKVEAALERVRSRAMAMHKTDELLDAAELIYRELSALGVTSMNISYAFVDENEKFGSYYSVNPVDGKTLPFPFIFPHTETDVMLSLLSSWKKQESFNVIELDEQATLKHQTYIGEHIQKQIAENNPEIPFTLDAFLAISPKKAVIYNFNFTQGYIFIIGNTHLTTEQEQMLLRFTKVFDLTFRRFLDLKQAEAQAREAQIELALERVRARTMAMHRSEELAETAQLLFHQLKDLGGIPDRISIGVVDEVDGVVNFWTTDQLGSHIDKSVKARLNERTVISKSYQAWKDNKRSMVIDLHGDDVKEWIKFVREEMGIAVKDEFIKDRRAQNLAFFSHGWILVTSHEPQSAETIQILERFASVFNLTYRRFLDLQKAEAQAREAQIEAALERVRSRTMAMQRSEELLEVINIFSDQLTKLDIYFDNVSFGVNDQADDFKFWLSSAGQPHPIQIQVPYYNNPAPNRVLEAQKKGLKFFADILTAEENKLWVQHLIAHSELKALPDNVKNYLLTSPGFARSTFILKNINLYIGNFKNKEYTEEENNIFKRFAQAFEQSYIRFLDLQKAEAQAREAHIEAALERVRARTMGMHQSKELHDVIETITNQLLALGLEFDNSVFCRINEDESWEMWMSTPQQSYPSIIHVPYLDHRVFNNLKEVKTKKIDFFTDVFDQDEARVFFKHFFANTIAENVPEERKQYVLSRSGFARSLFLTKDIWFVISRYAPDPFNDEENAILKRFAKVFEQSYTRFLDLQKAEAQAREAQIEAALERVRAASMAMHHSNELVKVATILYNQLISLGFDSVVSGGFNFPDDKNNIQKCWFADTGHEGYLKDFIIPLSGDAVLDQRIEYQQKNMPFLEQILIGEELRKHMEFVFPVNTASAAEGAARNAMPDPTVFTIRFLREGYLILVSNASLNEEQKAIVERFANAFNLAYTRFLDLQKAEAQAHEARIEISLERIRARALAMHKSDELMEVAKVLWEQMALLGQPELEASVVHLYEEDPDHIHSWRAVSIGTDSNTQLTYGHMAIPKNSCEVVREWLEKFYSDRKEYTIEIGGEKQKEWYDLLFKLAPDVINSMREKKDIHEKRYYRFSKFSGGALLMVSKQEPSVEVTYLQGRAAVVFDLAYRRFSDLQTAEAQAREAQIEAALERTRTQSMLMQHSNELDITSRVFHEQLLLLNIDSEFSYVWLPDVEKNKHLFWAAWSEEQNGSTILQSKSATYDLDKTEPYTAECFRAWESDEPVHIYPVASTEVKNFFDLWSEIMGDAKKLKPEFFPDGIYYDEAFMKYGCFGIVIRRLLTEDEKKILLRFTIEFERTYTRFLDLQKAEAQSREARIEAALEKVRASAMAMHNSDHVSEATGVLFSELDKLGIETMRCGIVIIHENQTMETWSATTTDDKKVIRISGLLDMTKHPLLIGGFKGWKNKEESYTYHLAGKDMENYYDFLAESPFYPIPKQRPDMPEHDCTIIYFNEGGLYTFSEKPHDDATIQVLKRFASVFSLTYRRYNDLKNAEAQAREAQIEAGLERVRAKAMAMHSSRDLAETLSVFYRELKSLSAIPIRCGVALMDKETRVAELTTMNTTGQGDSIEIIGKIKMAGHPVLDEVFENWLIQKEFHAILRGNQIKEYYQVLKPQISYLDYSHDEVQFGYYFMFKEGDVYAWTEKELTEGDLTIYRRFTTVISLTYKRYKDLQQAEAQAREAKIEAGLERVRARTMAMHSSDDVSTATATMFTELERLGIENFRGGITNILTNRTQHVWSVNNLAEGKIVKAVGAFNIDAHPFWQFMFGEWEAKKDFTYYFLAGQDKEEYIKILNKAQGYLPQAIQQFPDVHFQVYYFNEGAVWTNSLQPHSEEDQQVMKRFTSVFSLTFRRYQDLKKAEAQAREATIEAALERVRGKAMAMHSSEDLAATIVTFYHELELFSLTPRRCGVGLPDRETHIAELSTMNTTEIGNSIEVIGKLKMAGHPVLESIYENWLLQREYHPVLRGSEIGEYYQVMGSQITFPDYPNDIVQYGFFFYFPEGWVYAWTENEMQEDELKIYRRFTSVLSLTYKRYKDLQKAEANAREAVKQAALDRVRAEIASMRTINDLDRITPLIWNELTVLGIPFIRCGVFIMDEVQKIIHTFLSTPDGKAIAAFHLPYDTPGNFSDMLSHWYNKKTYISRWGEIDFIGIAETLVKQGAIANKEQYLVSLPKGGFYLHFLPFLQGMLYVGNTTQLKEEEIELIQHVADAFSTAYARYEDFNKLEAAKQQVEKTLTDLKQAQTQLVQSEKMASLGELTAGIAHEIQNPLNFVNNFSDVSNELLEEMKNELEKGNAEDAMAIVEDIKQNLEKILHHGKRADAIVKGMLQHSRTSSGQKEPTDINVLADEYLRLAFHGLRAKDKSFNAKFETDFDNSIGKISVIPQDIGRVILNLINNAFYAVTEKKKQNSNGYDPIVTVYTKKVNDKIEIKVKDNGNGIPQKVLDKIFQPFFTTKPTGQGTGLGLSLSYDIIKAHGGELKVETKEGDGAEFIIQIPMN